jgi:hypothetical protein
MAAVFLSYRRADSTDIAGRLFDHLVQRIGKENVFKDVDSIRIANPPETDRLLITSAFLVTNQRKFQLPNSHFNGLGVSRQLARALPS